MLLIIVGPSGVGKSTLCSDLVSHFDDIQLSISHTTRSPRKGEIDGKNYYFVDKTTFSKRINENEFAEHAQVHGNSYGSSKTAIQKIEKTGKTVLFDIDYQGALQLMKYYPNAVSIMILPPSMKELEARLRGRKTDDEEVIRRRLQKARFEMSHYHHFKYLLFNHSLETAKEELRSIYIASKMQMIHNKEKAERLLHD